MATAGSDRGIALYDLRTSTPIRKLIMQTKTNSIAWNPMEAFNFTAANEDCCLYTYDMRKLQSATCVHKDFVSAVMDVDYSPTGREFVAGSYDRSVRIFSHNGGHSKEVYHTKRMQRVFAVRFSGDGSYVFSGSDDMNVRVWKVGLRTSAHLVHTSKEWMCRKSKGCCSINNSMSSVQQTDVVLLLLSCVICPV